LHERALMSDLLKKPEFCAACHKSQVPQELNNYSSCVHSPSVTSCKCHHCQKNRRTPFTFGISSPAVVAIWAGWTLRILTLPQKTARFHHIDSWRQILQFRRITVSRNN